MSNLPPELSELADALRAQAQGVYATEAAVDLLIGHGSWLRRADFRDQLVDGPRDGYAFIDWPAVPEVLEHTGCSGSEARILRIAAELVGVDTGHGLDELLSPSLDDTNRRLVLEAVAHTLDLPAAGTDPRPGEQVERFLTDVVDVFGYGEDALWCETICARLAEVDPTVYAGWSARDLAAALRVWGVTTFDLWAPTQEGESTVRRGVRRDAVLEAIARRRGGETR